MPQEKCRQSEQKGVFGGRRGIAVQLAFMRSSSAIHVVFIRHSSARQSGARCAPMAKKKSAANFAGAGCSPIPDEGYFAAYTAERSRNVGAVKTWRAEARMHLFSVAKFSKVDLLRFVWNCAATWHVGDIWCCYGHLFGAVQANLLITRHNLRAVPPWKLSKTQAAHCHVPER
ncbi:hypothetical protein [Hyphomicrobium sp. D-2]|uniref:hypothetical protein n=1 Tax=Hyphomicrobium sp. D-2 TaxID=3041621 RepID=UPI002455100F|nr:hypothetical protein [Hyphomicrobium sp. D-2]MDH4981936.1 hypothetical protein [Hyphomicrobium sp. D-2]